MCLMWSVQYLLQGRHGALLLLFQSFDFLEQTASLQTESADLLEHLLIFYLTPSKSYQNIIASARLWLTREIDSGHRPELMVLEAAGTVRGTEPQETCPGGQDLVAVVRE